MVTLSDNRNRNATRSVSVFPFPATNQSWGRNLLALTNGPRHYPVDHGCNHLAKEKGHPLSRAAVIRAGSTPVGSRLREKTGSPFCLVVMCIPSGQLSCHGRQVRNWDIQKVGHESALLNELDTIHIMRMNLPISREKKGGVCMMYK